jgi:hypothetical protein
VGAEMAAFAQLRNGVELCSAACPATGTNQLGFPKYGYRFSIETIGSHIACGNSIDCGNMTAIRTMHVHGSTNFKVNELDGSLNRRLMPFIGQWRRQDPNNFSSPDKSLPSNLLYSPKFGLRLWDGQTREVIDYGY